MQKWIGVCKTAQMLIVTVGVLTIANSALATDPVATDAVRALRALYAATSAGVNKAEYQRRMIDTKVVVDEYLESPGTSNQDLRLHIERSMRLYELAGQAWADQISGARRTSGLSLPGDVKTDIYKHLFAAMPDSQRGCLGLRTLVKSAMDRAREEPSMAWMPPGYGLGLIPSIWECAGDEVKAASALTARVTSNTDPASGRAMSTPPTHPLTTPPAPSPTPAPAPSGTTSRATQQVGTIGLTMATGTEPTLTYLGQLKMVLWGKWVPPADDAGRNRVAVVLVNLDRAGRIKGVMLEKTSGNTTFDELALRAVIDSQRGPALPRDRPEETVLVRATFSR